MSVHMRELGLSVFSHGHNRRPTPKPMYNKEISLIQHSGVSGNLLNAVKCLQTLTCLSMVLLRMVLKKAR